MRESWVYVWLTDIWADDNLTQIIGNILLPKEILYYREGNTLQTLEHLCSQYSPPWAFVLKSTPL